MNRKLLAEIRQWKPVRSKAQIDLTEILQERFLLFSNQAGYFTIFDTDIVKVTKRPVTRPQEDSALPISDYFGVGLFSVNTEAEALKLRELLCFETEEGRWRFYWVRNTGLHAVGGGPRFSERHSEWIAVHIYKVWKKYVNPNRRKGAAQQSNAR